MDPVVKDDLGTLYDSASSLRQRLESFNVLQFTRLRKYRRPVETASDDELDKYGDDVSITDFVNWEANFNWKGIISLIYKILKTFSRQFYTYLIFAALTIYVESDNIESPLIEATLAGLELQLVQRTYSCEIVAKLGNISLTQNYENSVVAAISTPMNDADQEQYLFFCKLLMVGYMPTSICS